jgi:1-acyl-sn-glycerol-3-phosphate acyltransferase
MPRWLRVVVTAFMLALFFGGSPMIALLFLPWLRLSSRGREDYRRRVTYFLHRCLRFFSACIRFSRLADCPVHVALPAGVPEGGPYVLITNHPSLIDTVFLLGWFRGLTCVTKGSWYRSIVLGPMIRASAYLPGPGSGAEESEDMLRTMVEHLGRGYPLLVFPEGTRSQPDRLLRFRRGAVEAAIRAKVPIVPIFLGVDRPYLTKGISYLKVPKDTARYSVEMLPVVETRDLGVDDAKRINAELHAQFQARFLRNLAERAEGRVLPPSAIDPPEQRAA